MLSLECSLLCPGLSTYPPVPPKFRHERNAFLLTRAWQGYLNNTTDWGGGYFLPPPEFRNYWSDLQIYKIQTAFNRPGKFLEISLMLLTSGSPMTSQVRSKSALRPYKMEISQYNYIHGVWTTWMVSGTLLSMILSFQWVYSRSRSFKVTRSREVQIRNFMFGTRNRCF